MNTIIETMISTYKTETIYDKKNAMNRKDMKRGAHSKAAEVHTGTREQEALLLNGTFPVLRG